MTPSYKGTARLSAVALAALLCIGCTQRLGDFTLISTKNVDLSDASIDVKKGRRVTGEDCRFIALFIPLGEPSIKEAVDDALEKGNGNLLVDQVTFVRSWYVPLIVGESCYVAEGTAVHVIARARTDNSASK
jgi:hypothetical protein